MAEKLVTREPGSRWVPHPAFRHRLYPKCAPPTPSPPAPEGRRGRSPRSAASFSLRSAWRPAPRSPAPPASPGSGKRDGRRAGPSAGRSPRGRFPPPPQPPPPLTPGTRPGPRGSHRVTQPSRRLGEGGHGPAAPPQCRGTRRLPVGILSTRLRRAGCPSTPFPLRCSVRRSR